MAAPPDRIEVGYVARAHGIRGEICARTHDPDSTTLGDVTAVWIRDRRYVIEAARDTPRGWLLVLDGVPDRNAAEALRGATLEVERAELALGDDEVFLTDLIGFATFLPDGAPWGEVVALELGPQIRLVVRDGDVERQLPLVDALVPVIDREARRITVDPPEGLPEDPVDPSRAAR
ncbi:MAG: 16S rRNA processing protein RimM [Kofleriaceae bacterium]|nr:16S rRNA processing protein RimM [Myxococcales bacterium]MCB9572616.1 16S rRNA processing protein RimM [Kofleriaceae bacterium]